MRAILPPWRLGYQMIAKWVFNEASLTLWCPVVVHFELKMSRFSAYFQEDRCES